ncbi:cell wall-binding repeat-containing protein [Agromyces aurantiacus]|uniref:Cell wall-binding repeat-containing protein n=1 Tax=Agromyces aurantiacus TaxID=165814 RepID=A0ABV9R3R5_9MICO|nr:cell wall-binding repeat-containing protein [Agromyces aurantiacus]MBM7502661.1 putative cell wall-binding protein [Agromyces aurantiacus]
MTLLSIWQPSVATAAEIAPNLVSLSRTSGDVVAHGEDVVIAWAFDAPVDSVTVTLQDGLGGRQYLSGGWGGATSGEARGTIDTAAWPGGSVAFESVRYSWMSGETYHSVELDAQGDVLWISEGLADVPPAGQAIDVAPFEVQSDVDLSIPPALLAAARTTGEVAIDGDLLAISWETDRAVDSVAFRLRDSLGRSHRIEWSSWLDGAGPATAGTATAQIETPLWAGGEVVFDGLDYGWGGGSMSLDATGAVVFKQPAGLADATLPGSGLEHLRFTVDSAFDPAAVPLLTSLTRTSPDLVRGGDEIVLEWAFDSPVDSVRVLLRDVLGGQHVLDGWMFGPADAGDMRAIVDTAEWPRGEVVLEGIEYSWGGGGSWAGLDANGEVIWTSGADVEIPPAADAISFAPFQVESDVDLSIPPAVTSLSRISADVLANGDELQVAWSSDRPVEQVALRFRDPIGVQHRIWWSMWEGDGTPATEGIARGAIDTTRWAGGEAVFDGIEYRWGNSSISLDATGAVESRSPSGLQDAVLPMADLPGLSFTVESDIDLTAVPSLSSVTRISGDVLRDGEQPQIAWEFDAPVHWVAFGYVDGLGRRSALMWSGEPATSGIASVMLEGAQWAPGDAELTEVRYSFSGDRSIVLSRDGSIASKSPAGIDDPVPYAPGFAALDFVVETDAVFETVTVPAPVFTDATCDASAHLLLQDFEHGWWEWSPAGAGYGSFGDSFNGEPWFPFDDRTYTVTAYFEDGWGTTGETRWTHAFGDPGSCGPLLEFPSAPAPAISGDPVVGSALAAVTGEWAPTPDALSFQWMRDGSPIDGATQPTLALTWADAGTAIAVEVTGVKDGYVPTTRSSDPVLVTEPAPPVDPVTRVSGEGRAGRSVAVSAAGWAPGVDVAFVVNGSDEASAIAGAALAGASDGPVLPVKASSIPADVRAELDRLDPARIVVLGEARTVGDEVIEQLDEYTAGSVTRVAGEGVFGMSAAVSASGWPSGAEVAFVVNESDEASAFPGAALAASAGGPLLAVEDSSIPAEIVAELRRLDPERIVVLGATDQVGEAIMSQLGDYTDGPVTRVAGDRRFGTSAAISATGWSPGVGVAFVVNAADDASAIAGAALAGRSHAPVLSVRESSIPAEVRAELDRLAPKRIVVLGTTDAVDGGVLAELEAFVSG